MKDKNTHNDAKQYNITKSYILGLASASLPELSDSLGGNLHQISDEQLNRLISIRFKNDPLALIRQLSYDIALKESELIILRKRKFAREQELLKLCNQYANISAVEMDQKLNNVAPDQNVENILLGLIDTAIHEDLKIPDNIPHDDPSDIAIDRIEDRESTLPVSSRDINSPYENKFRRNSKWFSQWFHSTDRLPSVLRSNSDTSTKNNDESGPRASRSLSTLFNLNKTEDIEPATNLKAPVELERISVYPKDHLFSPPPEFDVDKYGFFNSENISNSSSPLRQNILESCEPCEILNQMTLERAPKKKSSYVSRSLTSSVTELEAKGTTDIQKNGPTMEKLREISRLHDISSQKFESKWESFFKDLSKDYYQVSRSNLKTDFTQSEEIFGTQGLNLINLDKSLLANSDDTRYYRRLKNLINERGIPFKYRYDLWLELSGAKNLRINGEFVNYYQIAKQTKNDTILANLKQIDLDLHRTMPFNIHFNDLVNSQPGPHFYKLQKILYAFAAYKSDVGYCQGMNKIIGNLILGDNSLVDEDVFWIFVGLIESILPVYGESFIKYFSIGSINHIKMDQTIMYEFYFPRLLPKLYEHLRAINIQIECITMNWWLTLFTETFPNVEIWFKIFDNLLISDIEIKLISLSLSIFKFFENSLCELMNENDIYLLMKNLNLSNFTKMNIRYLELIQFSNGFEKKIHKAELHRLREQYEY
ncbi:uncharacterized protein PRCAT00001987001 [Priceomyces carsonii]|uniref:uncharacterized protein n=1 Tax=Priceomyces carsonii TaxID=28549 RepID=UPI002EDA304D|nr:unnamed protein product [Priceomyces carsonii]